MKTVNLMWHCVCLLMVLTISSCSNEQVINQETGEAQLTFNVSPYEKMPMDADTRAVAAKDAVTRLSLALFQGDNAVISENQTYGGSSDTSFGTFQMTVPYGTYQLVVVGHKGTADATITSPANISFPNNELTDTYYYYETITVTKDSEKNLSIVLQHAMARFKLITTDAFPATIKDLTFQIEGGGTVLNATNGTAASKATQTKTFAVSSYAGKTVPYVQVFSILSSANEEALNITVTAKDANGNTLAERLFENVPMQRGYSTTYKGYFFSNQGVWTVTVDDAYTEKDETTF